jgi:hypothetical protein
MFSMVFRYLYSHFGIPSWTIFPVIYGLYILVAGYYVIDGYSRELFGHNRYHTGRIHHILYRFHTGQHVGTKHSYGDERNLSRTVMSGRQTPGGLNVYYSPWRRWQRALRNNLAIGLWLLVICGMVIEPANTVRVVTVLLMLGIAAGIAHLIRKARKRHEARRPVSRPAYARTVPARRIMEADATTAGARPKLEVEEKPKLEGVSKAMLATLLAGNMGCSQAEILEKLTITPDKAILVLPDSFGALIRERDPIQELIEAHTKGLIKFTWFTTGTPRTLSWFPRTELVLPSSVRFRDHLGHLQKLGPLEAGVGVRADRSYYDANHDGDKPWHCRFAGSGTGKSTGFLVKAAQICYNDPYAEIYCIDTKQISFIYLRDIPRVYVYDDPVDNMPAIWNVFGTLSGIMRSRYKAISTKKVKRKDLHNIWVFADEGNDLAANFNNYNKYVLGNTGAPDVWGMSIGPMFRQGREARMYGEFMFQDLDARIFGGETLKPAFSVFGAAGYIPQQFTRTIGPPAEPLQEGPGRILMCSGKNRTWVQGYTDDPNWLHEYALANRKDIAA